MIKNALIIILLLLAVSGICDFIYLFRISIFKPKSRFKGCYILFLNKNSALQQLRYLWEKFRWHGNHFTDTIMAFYDDIDSEELDECKLFCKGKNIVLSSCGENYSKWKTLI